MVLVVAIGSDLRNEILSSLGAAGGDGPLRTGGLGAGAGHTQLGLQNNLHVLGKKLFESNA